jgi:plastocyanin
MRPEANRSEAYKKMKRVLLAVATATALAASGFVGIAWADEPPTFEIRIKDHKFDPAELQVPANTEIKLVVKNLDATAEEFESYELNREKIIAGGGQGVFYLDPLKPGTYPFFGEFNQATAQGKLIVK